MVYFIDPSILKFLQERQSQQKSASSGENDSAQCEDDEGIDSTILDDTTEGVNEAKHENESENIGVDQGKAVENILGTNISEKWLHMDQLEPEKLEWMKNYQAPSARKSGVGLLNLDI